VTDLSEVRVRLDQMTERVISRLKDRSRFPRNRPVYEPGGVPIVGRNGISFLQFSLEGLEAYHASLGRFAYPDQFPLSSHAGYQSPVQRTVAQAGTRPVDIPIGDELVAFYIATLDGLCLPGEDPGTYGETVYVDADLLNLLHERVNVGRLVAEAKAADPAIPDALDDPVRLSEILRDRNREEALLDSVEQTAERYQLEPAIARRVFRWIIDETLALEVAYLQRVRGGGG
jgi:chorismate mutase